MFSRGNVSEKIRFGKLVAQGDKVLDLYAGIGYYTLPAVLHGKASHVVACEWNEHAVEALRYNIQDNHVEDRVTVLVGDCRIQAKEHGLVDMFDRVSLGLLPSSEGGWSTAVRALRSESGGWLHIHGNVPDKELESWALWVCHSLLSIVIEEKRPDSWIVVATHLERVKSFAPTVSHFVADVHLGPWQQQAVGSLSTRCGVMRGGLFIPCIKDVHPPSCALSATGVLNQAWMREE
jgi:tRNA G37 N-methylase Trm5